MNYTRKLASLLLALVMVFSLAVTAFAQDVAYSGTDAGIGTITIKNASKGETYSVYKLFDAHLSTDNSSICYTGTIPSGLTDYFEVKAGNIVAKEAAGSGTNMSDGLKSALKAWVEDTSNTCLASAEAEGANLAFKNLPYGYYVVKTTQGEAAVSVTSTQPNADVIDKNTTVPDLTKNADGESYSIGDTITYTLSFNAANFDGEASISQYTIHDTLPEFLSDVTVTKIMIGTIEYKQDGTVPQFDQTTKQIVIPWVDDDSKHIYNNGVTVTITYTATLNEKATFGEEGNKNDATLTYSNETKNASDTVYSYSFDVVKTDSNKKVLNGAKFELFDAKTDGTKIDLIKNTDGSYRVATADEKGVEGFTSAVIEAGKATIKGLKAGIYWLEETEAPAGYNKLTERQQVTIGNTNLDATVSDTTYTLGGVQVINNAGTQLPSTGGVGTTIFYVLGSVLVLAAVVLLVTKKRMGTEG